MTETYYKFIKSEMVYIFNELLLLLTDTEGSKDTATDPGISLAFYFEETALRA